MAKPSVRDTERVRSRYGPRNSKWCPCLPPRAGLYAAVRTAPERSLDPECGKELGDTVWAESTSGCLSDDVPGQPQRIGQGETRRHSKPKDTGGHPSQKRFVTRKVGTSVNPADFMPKPTPRPQIEQLMKIMCFEFMRTVAEQRENCACCRIRTVDWRHQCSSNEFDDV